MADNGLDSLYSSEYDEAPITERINMCTDWLQENPSSPSIRAVQHELSALRRAETLEEKMRARSLGSLRNRYPVLMDRTASGPYIPQNHKSATIDEDISEYPPINNLINDEFWNASLWPEPPEDSINCDSEICAQSHVVAILKSVLRGLKLSDIVEVITNRTLAGAECDILMVYKPNRLPFSCIEVKKPCNTPADRRLIFDGEGGENLVAGELYDESKAVELFGFKKVVGMITTGNHWRLTCTQPFEKTPDDFVRSLDTVVQRIKEHGNGPSGQDAPEDDSTSSQQSYIEFKSDDEASSKKDERTMYACKVVPGLDDSVGKAGEKIVQVVVLYVLKSCLTLVELLDRDLPKDTIFVRPKMPCRKLTENEQVFAFGTVSLETLNLEKFIPHGVKNIFVIHHLGSGVFGDCCFGTITGATCCAVKFFHRLPNSSAATEAKRELKNWNTVYGKREEFPKCFNWKIAGEEACLVMPYLRPIRTEERHSLLVDGTIDSALKQFAASGCTHSDIKWRHFGWYQGQIFLSDLGSIKKSTDEEIKSWREESLAYLEKTAGTTQPNTPSGVGKQSGTKRKNPSPPELA